jgi:hypothetical protein
MIFPRLTRPPMPPHTRLKRMSGVHILTNQIHDNKQTTSVCGSLQRHVYYHRDGIRYLSSHC